MHCTDCVCEHLGRAQAYLLTVWSRSTDPAKVWLAIGFIDLAIDSAHALGGPGEALVQSLVNVRNRTAARQAPLSDEEFSDLVSAAQALAVDGGDKGAESGETKEATTA